MKARAGILAALALLAAQTAAAQTAARQPLPPVGAVPARSDDIARPGVRAAALSGSIQVDGKLDDAAWAAVQPATDFLQFDPASGHPATQRTEIRFAYDDHALYIGARMYDDEGAAGVRSRLGRRDDGVEGDNIQFVLDTFHDHTGRTFFQVNPSGVKSDAGQAAAFMDPSWDPVWEAATQVDSLGWTAELRIPFSQLRFGETSTWGMQVWRYVERINELSMWAFWARDESGGPALFGHLEALDVPTRQLGVELLPYLVGRAERITPVQPDNPFLSDAKNSWRIGGDVKAILGSTLTLDATINPDFGQVEVDPAVVNLSAFETFFPERRPFFVEGSGLFGFGSMSCFFCSNTQSLSLFYSRRIGRRPQGFVSGAAEYVSMPENTTILGAAKVTGRTKGGWQLGVLNAVTGSERADAQSPLDTRFTEEVEPLTNYGVARVRRNFAQGNLQLGAIATSVVRRFDNDALRGLLTEHAEAVGVDWQAFWKNRAYSLMGQLALSNVAGDSAAIARIQRAPARYYQRPDRAARDNGFLTDGYDTSLGGMRGIGGYTRIAKQAGTWQWEAQANFRTPGFEANDLAFLTRTDYVQAGGNLRYQKTQPTKYTRYFGVTAGLQQQYNFEGDRTDGQYHASVYTDLQNFWSTGLFTLYRPETFDDRLTRGGAMVRKPALNFVGGHFGSDSRRKVVLNGNVEGGRTSEGGRDFSVGANARFKPASNLSIAIGPNFSRNSSVAQFVGRYNDPTATHFFDQRVIFAGLEQRTLSMTARVNATFSPTLTLEVFAQPFISSGDYDAFKEFTAPRTLDKHTFDASQVTALRTAAGRDSVYVIDADRNPGTQNISFRNPDFNVRSLRGNAVLRWEYRPGSTLFLVWQQQRSGQQSYGDFDLGRDAGAVFSANPDNIFLMKVSYWFGR
ncbi:MAG TPA: DUF5916 domain-containing protein [Longimicrobiales bacterium]|nr:DUF5916 domain-containing protein [Longimicrobiales bacterium]